MKGKRLVTLLLAVLMVVSLASVPALAGSSDGDLIEVSVLGKESANSYVKLADREKYTAWQNLEELFAKNGIKVNLEIVPIDQYEVTVQTRMASNSQLGDITNATPLTDTALINLGYQGIIKPINEIMSESAEAFLEANAPFMSKLSAAPDGNTYWFTSIMYSPVIDLQYSQSFAVSLRSDWVEALELDMPATLDEFTQLCLDVREKDANGNGVEDEVIYVSPSYFMNGIAQWFGLGSDWYYLDQQTGTVMSPWYSDTLVNYIEYMRELIALGVFDPSMIDNADLQDQRVIENSMFACYGYVTQNWLDAMVVGADNAYYQPFYIDSAVEGVDPYYIVEPNWLSWDRFVVTNNEEGVARFLDTVYSDEYLQLTWYGTSEGVTYQMVDGEVKYYDNITAEEASKTDQIRGCWMWGNSVFPQHRTNLFADGDLEAAIAASEGVDGKRHFLYTHVNYYDRLCTNFDGMFYAQPSEDQLEQISDMENDLNTYSEEMLAALILGEADLNDLDSIVAQLQELGLDDYIAIRQSQHEAYLAF